MNIKVLEEISCVSNYSEEDYGEWSEEKTTEILGIESVEDNSYFDLATNEELFCGVKYFLVYACYSAGDSFGWSTGNIEYIKIFHSLSEAKLFKEDLELLEKYCKSDFKEQKPLYLDEVSTEYNWNRKFKYFGESFCLPWGGYFESLEDVDIKEVSLKYKI